MDLEEDPLIEIKDESFPSPEKIPSQDPDCDYSEGKLTTILSEIQSIETEEEDDEIKVEKIIRRPPKSTPSRPPRPSDSVDRSCLFCPKFAPKELKEFQWKIPGAGCPSMEKHLQTIFIVHKLLDLPSSWSEEILSKGGELPPVHYWLRVCTRCFPQIETAWGLHQQLLSVQDKINEIKKKLKNKIFVHQDKRLKTEGRNDLMNEIREFALSGISGSEVIISNKKVPNSRRKKIKNEDRKMVKEDLFKNFDDLQVELDDDDGGIGIALDSPDNFHDDDPQDPDWNQDKPSGYPKVINDNPSEPEDDDEAELLRLRRQHKKVTHLKNYKPMSRSSPFWGKLRKNPRICNRRPRSPPPKDKDKPEQELPMDEESAQRELERLRRLRKKVTHLPFYKPINPGGSGGGSRSKRVKKTREKPYRSSRPLRCEKCPARFEEGQEDKLKEHMDAHERCSYGNNEFMCKRCKFPCETEEELQAHVKRRHPRLQKMECPISDCKFVTFTVSKLHRHLDQVHSGLPKPKPTDEELTCSLCQKKTGNRAALGRHKRTEHPEIFGVKKLEPENMMQCDKCGEKFDNVITFERHKKIHIRRETPDNFFCEVCGKGFKIKARLREHMANHEEKGAWMCSLCGVDYKFKHNLTKHQQTHHPETMDPGRVNPNYVRKRNVDIIECKICHLEMPAALHRRHLRIHDDRPYKCDECDRSYFKEQGLRKHKEINHSNGTTNVNCPYCNKLFIHPEYLKWHYKYCRLKRTAEENNSKPSTSTSTVQIQEQEQHEPQPQSQFVSVIDLGQVEFKQF